MITKFLPVVFAITLFLVSACGAPVEASTADLTDTPLAVPYDINGNNRIDKDEIFAVITDYFEGLISKALIFDIIRLYFSDGPISEKKQYALDLINGARGDEDLAPVTLGNNTAAQQHAAALLRHNIHGHWGIDGWLPQMRYTLAGGVNYVSENVSGPARLEPGITYRKQKPRDLLLRSHQGLMGSPGHRKNILNKWHKKVNLGIDCNDYTCSVVQKFAGDYVEFDQKPTINKGTIRFEGRLKGGFRLTNAQVWYHEPPHPLTVEQLDAAHSYIVGQEPATFVLPPPPPGSFYPELTTEYSWFAPTDPYKVDPDDPENAPPPITRTKTVPYTVADAWSTSASGFQVQANIGKVMDDLGLGVYIVALWGKNGNEHVSLTNFTVFVD